MRGLSRNRGPRREISDFSVGYKSGSPPKGRSRFGGVSFGDPAEKSPIFRWGIFIKISPFKGISYAEKPRKPVSVTKTNSPIPDGRLFVVGAATGGDRMSAEGKTGVRRQCAVCSRSGRIASGITLRRLRGGASEALVPECRRCPPATVGALSGGTVAGETRRKGVQYSPVRERNKIGDPAEKSLIFRWGINRGPRQKDAVVSAGHRCLGAINENYHFIRRFYPVRIHTQINPDASDVFALSRIVYAEALSVL